MVEAPPPPAQHPPPADPAPADSVQNFVFKRELDQIYLLIDHITTSASKRLPAPVGNETDLIKGIATIQYPPSDSATVRADQATTLIHALDELNRAAAPANGMTVAFTLLVAGEESPKRDRKEAKGPLTRLELAIGAFPTLVEPARRFKFFNNAMIYGLVAFFVFTCLLSWNVATGNALLGQVTAQRTAYNDVSKQIAAAENADFVSKPGSAAPASSQTDIPAPFIAYCERFLPAVRTKQQVELLDGASGIPLCTRRSEIEIQLVGARRNLREWITGGPWGWFSPDSDSVWPIRRSTNAGTASTTGIAAERDEVEAQWAAAALQILGGAVLPIFYGLLGAAAAVVRSVSARIKESVLAPRDLMLSSVQLVLGAVIGGCIGLFITPAGAGPQGAPSLLGSVQLSASALCFVAGFGVEGVFVALETLIGRIFNISDPAQKPPPTTP